MEKEPEFSPEESLKIIATMISKSKGSVADNSFYFLLWGWLVLLCCIGQYILKVFLHYPNHSIVWLSMPFAGIVSWIYGSRQAKQLQIKSFVTDAIQILWMALGITMFVLILIILASETWNNSLTYFILIYAIGTFVTGKFLQFKPLILGGLINFAIAAISVRFSANNQLLLCALAIITSYIIPGHLLRAKYQSQKK